MPRIGKEETYGEKNGRMRVRKSRRPKASLKRGKNRFRLKPKTTFDAKARRGKNPV